MNTTLAAPVVFSLSNASLAEKKVPEVLPEEIGIQSKGLPHHWRRQLRTLEVRSKLSGRSPKKLFCKKEVRHQEAMTRNSLEIGMGCYMTLPATCCL